MKISIDNVLDIILKKLNLKRINNKERGEVIKFDTNVKDKKKDENITRKGSKEVEIKNENKKTSRYGVMVLTSMVLLLMLSLSLGIRGNNITTTEEIQPKTLSSVAVSSNIDNSTDGNVIASKVIAKKEEEKLIFSKPIEGEIQKMYSIDKVIYSKTLSQWKTHDGLDISPTSSLDVKAVERGVVDDVYNDSFYGKTIVIEHISGYKTQYSNLDENVYVKIGESVVKGQKIGKVGNTSVGEYLDDPHLHFMIFLNGKSVNPTYLYN